MLDSRDPDLEFAKQILARLERYAAKVRAGEAPSGIAPPEAPARKHPMATATAPVAPAAPSELPWLTRDLDDQLPSQSQPASHRRAASTRRIDPATVDLFPYDLSAAIVTCALIVFAFASVGSPFGIFMVVVLVAACLAARFGHFFPSAGVKGLVGIGVGLVLVFLS